jgi:transposase
VASSKTRISAISSSRVYWVNQVKNLDQRYQRKVEGPIRERRIVRKLTADEVNSLIAGYKAGTTVHQLADRFKIHRATVSGHLHGHGGQMRMRGMSGEQVNRAAALYRQGWSAAPIGIHFGVDVTTVWRKLRRRGVDMRKPYERKPRP